MRLKSSYWVILAVFLVAFSPIVFSILFHQGVFSMPQNTKNLGQLNSKPIDFTALPIKELWSWVYVNKDMCGQECQNDLLNLRNAHLVLARDANKAQRIYLDTSASFSNERKAALNKQDSTLVYVHLSLDHALRSRSLSNGLVFLVDPTGQSFLFYDNNQPAGDWMKDLRFLIKHQS